MQSNPTNSTDLRGPRHLPIALQEAAWPVTLQRVDRAVADAAVGYLQDLRQRGVIIDPLAWVRELDRLASGRRLDYSHTGLPALYAIRYMPKRVISLLGALAFAGIRIPSLLDVGTGTGAAIVAAQVLSSRDAEYAGLDSSQEMLNFAAQTQRARPKPARFIEGSLESFARSGLPVAADLVTFSAPFPRDFALWSQLARVLESSQATHILAVEPETRGFLLDAFSRTLASSSHWRISRSHTGHLPDFMKSDLPLPAITRVWRQLGMPGSYRPQAWWEPPGDQYLLATRAPQELRTAPAPTRGASPTPSPGSSRIPARSPATPASSA